jgi:hypothetical protein
MVCGFALIRALPPAAGSADYCAAASGTLIQMTELLVSSLCVSHSFGLILSWNMVWWLVWYTDVLYPEF